MSGLGKIQRTLFRMQADPAFAAALAAGDEAAWAGTGLDGAGRELLRRLDPAGISADPGGRRRTQIAGNAASEYAATLAAAARGGRARFLEGFLGSAEFHEAVVADRRLPLAFGDYARRVGREAEDGALGAVARLEAEMAELRRAGRECAALPAGRLAAGEVCLAPGARLVALPAGTLEWAAALRAALDADRAAPAPPAGLGVPDAAAETLLVFAWPAASAHRLPEVHVERLEPPADRLFALARRPLGREERAAFARDHGADPQDLEGFLAQWIADGMLLRGT